MIENDEIIIIEKINYFRFLKKIKVVLHTGGADIYSHQPHLIQTGESLEIIQDFPQFERGYCLKCGKELNHQIYINKNGEMAFLSNCKCCNKKFFIL